MPMLPSGLIFSPARRLLKSSRTILTEGMVSATSYSLKRAFNAVSRLERYALIAGGDSEKSERSDEISVGTVKCRARERNLAPPPHEGRKCGDNLPA